MAKQVSCKHLPMCKCIKPAKDPCPEIATFKDGDQVDRVIAGGPLPKCHEDIRDHLQQQQEKDAGTRKAA